MRVPSGTYVDRDGAILIEERLPLVIVMVREVESLCEVSVQLRCDVVHGEWSIGKMMPEAVHVHIGPGEKAKRKYTQYSISWLISTFTIYYL